MRAHLRLETPSGLIHVADGGRGQPVLMIHGLLASSRMFESLLERLPEGWRGLALDLPGFGESATGPGFTPSWEGFARSAIETADALGLERFDLVGHSMGGGIAIVVAALWPERVRRLVLVDAVALPYDVLLKGRLPLVPVLGEVLFKLYSERVFTNYFLHDVFFDAAAMDRERVAAWFRVFAANRSLALAALRATADPGPVTRAVSKVRAETFVVWGERDAIIPVAIGARLASELPGARFHVVPDCGHTPLEERPDDACPAVVAFLAADPARRAGTTPRGRAAAAGICDII